MKLKQIFEEMRKAALQKSDPPGMLDWAMRNFVEKSPERNKVDWTKVELDPQAGDIADKVQEIYGGFRFTLQLIGGELINGQDQHDQFVWEDASSTLEVMREVLNKHFPQVELPAARVVSIVSDMLERGLLEQSNGSSGQKLITLKASQCDFKIRITKIPKGPAPEAVRASWVGLILPAFQFPGNRNFIAFSDEAQGHKKGYGVPIIEGLEVLRTVSPEAESWFRENFGILGNFTFGLDEAEVVTAENA